MTETTPTPPAVSEAMREAVAPVTRAEVRDCIGPSIPLRRRWVDLLMQGPIARLQAEIARLTGALTELSAAYDNRHVALLEAQDKIARLTGERDAAVANAREPIGDTWDEIRRLEGECRVFIRERDEWKAVANRDLARAEAAEAETARLRAENDDLMQSLARAVCEIASLSRAPARAALTSQEKTP